MLGKIMMTAAAAALTTMSLAGEAEAQQRYADCGGNSRGGNEAAGAIVGGILGGVIGNQVFKGERTLGTVAGVILGGVAGSQLARSGDDCDQYYASYAYQDAFEGDPYQRVSWRNDRSGNYGYVEPRETYRDRRGRNCRQYEQEIYINGRRQIAEGVACRQRDGTWQIIE